MPPERYHLARSPPPPPPGWTDSEITKDKQRRRSLATRHRWQVVLTCVPFTMAIALNLGSTLQIVAQSIGGRIGITPRAPYDNWG